MLTEEYFIVTSFVYVFFPLTTLLRRVNKEFVIDGYAVSRLLYMDDLKLYAT